MLLQDARYALRALRQSPGFTLVALLTLALGIGATTSLFSVVHGVLLRPLPWPDADRIVRLQTLIDDERRSDRDLSPPNFASLVEETRTLSAVSAVNTTALTLTGAGEARAVDAARVSAAFFDVLGVQPALGRAFLPGENEPGSHTVAILGHGLWQRVFGGDPAVVGTMVELDGVAHTVVGVMPASFWFPTAELWVPLEYGTRYSAATTDGRFRNTWLPVYARMRPDASIERAREELRAIGIRLARAFPESNTGTSFTATPVLDEIVGEARTPLLLLFGAVAIVLLVACANLVGLQLARAASRRGELTVRAALGAGRTRLVRQLVTESVVLGLLGGLAGLVIAVWATNALVALRPEGIPRVDSIAVDGVVLAFTFVVALGVGLLAGLLPAVRATESMSGTLREAGRGAVARGDRLRAGIVVGQTALAVVLLIGAGLLLRSFARLIAVDPGFRTERVLTFRVDLPDASYDADGVRAFHERLAANLEAHASIEAAGAINRLPIAQGSFSTRFSVEGRAGHDEVQPSIGALSVTPGYFAAMGIAVVRGRGIAATDRAAAPPVVVINETAARLFFPDEDPVGRRLSRFSYDPIEDAAESFTIVGVVADARGEALNEEPVPEAFFAHAQVPLPLMQVVVRTGGETAAAADIVRAELTALDARLPAPELRPMEGIIAASVARPRFVTLLLTLFAGVTLALAAIGIFGLLSYSVARRTREIGVRIALGARPREVVLDVVRDAAVLAAIGIGCGILGAIALTRILESQLFGVGTTDALTYALVVVLLAGTAIVAALIPARRAAAVDPIVALRQE